MPSTGTSKNRNSNSPNPQAHTLTRPIRSCVLLTPWILAPLLSTTNPDPLPANRTLTDSQRPGFSISSSDIPKALPWALCLGLAGGLLAIKRRSSHTNRTPKDTNKDGVPRAIADELKHAKEAAESANRAKDEFLAALSHELRSPLNPVLLLASEYARSTSLPQRLREDFQIILHNVRLQARLIDDLLDLNRIQRGGLSISARRLNLCHVLNDVCKGLQSEAQEREVSLELESLASLCEIRGDNARLHQIFGNIIRNAIKFAPRLSSVRVTLRLTLCSARVTIADSGPGIREEDLQRIFTPFVQAPHPAGSVGSCGLGLGLSIAQRLVERHRGIIWAESDGSGKGARFHVELPLEPADPSPSQPEENHPRGEMPLRPRPLQILLLEDHESTRIILARMLQRQGYDVRTAASIDAASRLLSESKVDVLVSDLSLPDGEGFPLPFLWKDSIQIGSIALSGFGMENDIARSRACGFLRHLTKPVEFQALLEALESLCQAGLTPTRTKIPEAISTQAPQNNGSHHA